MKAPPRIKPQKASPHLPWKTERIAPKRIKAPRISWKIIRTHAGRPRTISPDSPTRRSSARNSARNLAVNPRFFESGVSPTTGA
jgi:hypothetical protein